MYTIISHSIPILFSKSAQRDLWPVASMVPNSHDEIALAMNEKKTVRAKELRC